MTRIRCGTLLLVLATAALVYAQDRVPTTAYRFVRLTPDVFTAVGTGKMNVGGNATIIINTDDVLVVDCGTSPEVGRTLFEEIKTITNKPIRTVVDTHFHYDHASGNQVFAPSVEIIGHQFTRAKLLTDVMHEKGVLKDQLASIANQIDSLRKRAAAEPNPEIRQGLEQQARVQETFVTQIAELRPTPPNVAIGEAMTIFRGDREIRIMHLGRAHTGGDIAVYLPKERIIATGDVLVNGARGTPPYLGDAHVNEWPATLERLGAIDFDIVSPGHGEPFTGRDQITFLQAYLRDLWQQASQLHAAGVPAADAAARIDLTAHKAHYSGIRGIGVGTVAVSRIYEVIESTTLP